MSPNGDGILALLPPGQRSYVTRLYLTDSKHLFLPIDDFQEQTITERTDLINRIEHRTAELLHSCPTTQTRSSGISLHVDAKAATSGSGPIEAGQERHRSAGASRRHAEKTWPGGGAAFPVLKDPAGDGTPTEAP